MELRKPNPLKNYGNPRAKERENFIKRYRQEKREAEATRLAYLNGKAAMGRNE